MMILLEVVEVVKVEVVLTPLSHLFYTHLNREAQ